jgi:hypothetical protein
MAGSAMAQNGRPTVGTYKPTSRGQGVVALYLRAGNNFAMVRQGRDSDKQVTGTYDFQPGPADESVIRFRFSDGTIESFDFEYDESAKTLELTRPISHEAFANLKRTECGDGTVQVCRFIRQPECVSGDVLVAHHGCLQCVNPETCVP